MPEMMCSIGGAGNDYLSGGAGNDTYKFAIGDGVDTIYEQSGAADVILMGAGITAGNIRFEKSSYDLNIYYGTSDKITLSYQFYDDMNASSSYDEVETLKFSDGSTINLKSGLTFTGTAAADSVVGTSMADNLVGLAGNDSLYRSRQRHPHRWVTEMITWMVGLG
jgi:Ca2+-binding RTX toxin-like protein